MKRTGRLSLAVVVVMAGAVMLPPGGGRLLTPEAGAQIPSVPDILRKSPGHSQPKPKRSSPPPRGPIPSLRSPAPQPSYGERSPDQKAGRRNRNRRGKNNTGGSRRRARNRRGGRGLDSITRIGPGGYMPPHVVIPGSFNTERLVAIAARLRSLGMSEGKVREKVFPPFILAGRAAWVDSWGAPRFGPAPGQVRSHEGQDVFCDYGAPVLATEAGTVDYGDGGLGGKVARLYRPDGTYWYYAHLSDWNLAKHPSGSRVERGDVIGFCGNSGDAVGGAPHVHFSRYGGGAMDPMRDLIRWLRTAERKAQRLVVKATGKRVAAIGTLTLSRRFGDSFAPDRSELKVSGEALWASGSSPATGAFSLASTALETALAGPAYRPRAVSTPAASPAGELPAAVDPGRWITSLMQQGRSPRSARGWFAAQGS